MKIIFILLSLLISVNVFSQKEIKWHNIEDAVKLNNKPIFINVYTRWCEYSTRMINSTFVNDSVVDLMNKYFIAVDFNAEYKKNIKFEGKTYEHLNPYGHRKPHQLTKKLLNGKVSYPTYLLILDGEIINITHGFVEVYDMVCILTYIGEDIYKTKTWEEYQEEVHKELLMLVDKREE